MSIFNSSGGAGSAAAGMTPAGATAQALAQIAAIPNTSASGDITTGPFRVGAVRGGVNFGMQVPPWIWVAGAAFVAFWLYKRLK